MSLLLIEHFHTAKSSLQRTKTRTLLTVLGITIGIASITAILALGSGVTHIINRQLDDIEGGVAVIRPISKPSSLVDLSNPTPTDAYTTSPLTERDLVSINETKGVEVAAPLMTLSGSVRSGSERPSNVTILATTPDFPKTTKAELQEGHQFIDSVTLENTAVLGQQLAVDLFGTDQAAGKTFFLRGQKFTVIGVLKAQRNPINFNNIDLDHAVIISLTTGKLFNGGVAQIQQINVKAKRSDEASMKKLQSLLGKTLARNHDNERNASILVGDEIARPTSNLFVLINGVMTAIAGISLVVGGIGIMNIMLVGVAERTREIGLRKAVGASDGAIVLQFLIEAFIISLIGGALGYIGGYATAFIISWFLPYDPSFTWQIAATAFVLSVVVGIVFGLYPAFRAARKNVIESLRRYH